jgi:predicted kinase
MMKVKKIKPIQVKKCIVLIGPPCSGKSTWAKEQNLPILSCDDIRMEYNNGKYIHNPFIEGDVWDDFYISLSSYTSDFIVDNTNCKEVYIKSIIRHLPKDFTVEYKVFDVPLYKLYYRNIVRYLKTSKWIPFTVIKRMKTNFDNIKQNYK